LRQADSAEFGKISTMTDFANSTNFRPRPTQSNVGWVDLAKIAPFQSGLTLSKFDQGRHAEFGWISAKVDATEF